MHRKKFDAAARPTTHHADGPRDGCSYAAVCKFDCGCPNLSPCISATPNLSVFLGCCSVPYPFPSRVVSPHSVAISVATDLNCSRISVRFVQSALRFAIRCYDGVARRHCCRGRGSRRHRDCPASLRPRHNWRGLFARARTKFASRMGRRHVSFFSNPGVPDFRRQPAPRNGSPNP